MNKFCSSLVLAAACALAPAAAAQGYPAKPIPVVVPFSAGGPTDTLARILGERMRTALGQPILVEDAEEVVPADVLEALVLVGEVEAQHAAAAAVARTLDAGWPAAALRRFGRSPGSAIASV